MGQSLLVKDSSALQELWEGTLGLFLATNTETGDQSQSETDTLKGEEKMSSRLRNQPNAAVTLLNFSVLTQSPSLFYPAGARFCVTCNPKTP